MPEEIFSEIGPISLLSILGTLTGIVFGAFKFYNMQKDKKDLEFVKNLEYYDNELSKLKKEFKDSPQKFENCCALAQRWLVILDRLSFLKTKKYVNYDFVQYFENSFNVGRSYLKWLERTNRIEGTKLAYHNFREMENTIKYQTSQVVIEPSFYYYAIKFVDSTYDPKDDSQDPTKHDITSKSIDILASKKTDG